MGWWNKQNGDAALTHSNTCQAPVYEAKANIADQTVDCRGFLYSKNYDRPCISHTSQVLVIAPFGFDYFEPLAYCHWTNDTTCKRKFHAGHVLRISRFVHPLQLCSRCYETLYLKNAPPHPHKTGITFRNLESRVESRATSFHALTDATPKLNCN
jgi:hypothetical protein